ncbi:hypothetical protein B0H13DRAFT_2329493 [Mycena leptocephala]|nr:hypothetical protein B0H13DRAFT_2329493 [Mycena leptocephala]
MEYPRAHLYQASIRRFFPVVSSHAAASISSAPTDSQLPIAPVVQPFIIQGIGAASGPVPQSSGSAIRGEHNGLPIRHFVPKAGTSPALAISVELWAEQHPIDVDEVERPLPDVGSSSSSLNVQPDVDSLDSESAHSTLTQSLADERLFTCPICSDTLQYPVVTNCLHVFCDGCMSSNFRYSMACPLCRAIIKDPPMQDSPFEDELADAIARGLVPTPTSPVRSSPYTWGTELFPPSA